MRNLELGMFSWPRLEKNDEKRCVGGSCAVMSSCLSLFRPLGTSRCIRLFVSAI